MAKRFRLLRALLWDFGTRVGRYFVLEWMVRELPGLLGIEIRRYVLGRRFKRAGAGLVIYPGARILGVERLSVGKNCRIGLDNVIQANGGIEMGDDVVLGPGVKIWSVNHAFTRLDIPIWEQGYDHKKVVLGNGVWVGADSFIMPGARIGDHVVISAGSVVGGKDVEPGAVLAGNPARVIGNRRERALSATASPPGGP